jgi:hypothetical protein
VPGRRRHDVTGPRFTNYPKVVAGLWHCYRQTDIDPRRPVFWRPGSDRRPVLQESARWHVKGEGYAQYMSASEDGAWAEIIRAGHVSDAAIARGMLRHMWRCYVVEQRIADLRTPGLAQDVGIDPEVLIGPHEACQELGRQLVASGYRGVLCPSAALEGAVNLTLFGPRDEHHLMLGDRFDRRFAHRDVIEVRLLSPAAQPPEDLIGQVRQRDAPPSSYARWPAPTAGLPQLRDEA